MASSSTDTYIFSENDIPGASLDGSKVAGLKYSLASRGAPVKGKKADLVARYTTPPLHYYLLVPADSSCSACIDTALQPSSPEQGWNAMECIQCTSCDSHCG